MTAPVSRPCTLTLLHHGPDLHVYALDGEDVVGEDAWLWPGLGAPRVEIVDAIPSPRAPGIGARQVLDQLAWPVGTPEPVLWHRLVRREGRAAGLWVQEVVRPGFWRVRAIGRVQEPAIEWGLWGARRLLDRDGRR